MAWLHALPVPIKAMLSVALILPSLLVYQVVRYDLPSLLMQRWVSVISLVIILPWVGSVLFGLWYLWRGEHELHDAVPSARFTIRDS